MASSSANRKRSFSEADDDSKPPQAKRVRFPKGKKVKSGDEGNNISSFEAEVAGPVDLQDPKLAAKERAKRRSANTTELFNEDGRDEVTDYQENEIFVEDGIRIDPFNLDQEREEGFFEKDGNYVEYVNNNEIKDAWLDSIGAHTELAPKAKAPTINEGVIQELSAEDIGKIKRRIADSLEPGETVLQALKRLKGTPKNRKERMPAETKRLFDQLTEDAMNLLGHGEYDVYQEQQEVFEREAEGYERLMRARDGDYDMFGDGDDDNTAGDVSASAPTDSANGDSQSDYVFDEATGYYYSSSLGYYYDPSTGLYCSAASGQWYSYNEATGAYEEIPANESNDNN